MQQPRFPSPGPPVSRYPPSGYPARPGGPFSGRATMTPGQIGSPMPGHIGGAGTVHGPMGTPRMGPGAMPPPPSPAMGGMPPPNYPATPASASFAGGKSTTPGPSKQKKSDKEKNKQDKQQHESGTEDSKSIQRPGMAHALQSALERKQGSLDMRSMTQMKPKKKKKMADKILPQRVRDLVPESQAYMDLLSFERQLDSTIMRKRLDIQEALKRPLKQNKKLRIFISNTFFPAKHELEDGEETVASWELRVEGKLLEDPPKMNEMGRNKRKFSSFFKSLVIELERELYGPDNHLVEWHRTATTQETDGFQVKRPGDQNVKCTVLLMLDYQPMQFKLDPRLARLLGIHTQTRPVIINALWQYIKTHKLQDAHEREYINCDKYLEQIFECPRLKFSEIPQRIHPLLAPPDPIVIQHTIVMEGPDAKKTACYDIDVEVDDTLKQHMNNFLLSTQSQQEIAALDHKIHETVETINQLKTSRDFLLSFANEPQEFIHNWLISQTRDLKTMADVTGNPEEERHTEYYFQTWSQEAVGRYFYNKVQQRRAELEQALGLHN